MRISQTQYAYGALLLIMLIVIGIAKTLAVYLKEPTAAGTRMSEIDLGSVPAVRKISKGDRIVEARKKVNSVFHNQSKRKFVQYRRDEQQKYDY